MNIEQGTLHSEGPKARAFDPEDGLTTFAVGVIVVADSLRNHCSIFDISCGLNSLGDAPRGVV